MKESNDNMLVKSFPNLYVDRNASIQESCMPWGFCCGDGWYEIIYDLSAKLEKLIEDMPEPKPKASQVKEKFGGLRFYMDNATDEMYNLIDEAEGKSYKTCEYCGKEGSINCERNWIKTLCAECAELRDE